MNDQIILNIYNDSSIEMTLREIERISLQYKTDVIELSKKSLRDIFNFVSKKIIYKKDPSNFEFLMRPKRLLQKMAGDCDDKTIIILSCFHNQYEAGRLEGFGYSIVAQGKKDFHHIFPFIIVGGRIKDFDATYPQNKPLESKEWTKRKNTVLKMRSA